MGMFNGFSRAAIILVLIQCLYARHEGYWREEEFCQKHDSFNDAVYGAFVLPPYIQSLLKTKPLLRLQKIHQLGLLSIIDQANYTRYEHSIGAYYQARQMLNALENNSKWITTDPEWKIHRTCVEVAALMHDTGHGPYSHTWERIFNDYNHEKMSSECVKYVFENLESENPELLALKANNNYGVKLVQNLIRGKIPAEFPEKYRFLFEIVHNAECKLDVDKLDYLQRDYAVFAKKDNALQELVEDLKIQNADGTLNLDSIFLNARVSDDGKHIEYNYEDYKTIYALFVLRWYLHLNYYRKPVNVTCDLLMAKAILQCNGVIDGKRLNEINATDMHAFYVLNDENIMNLIKDSEYYPYIIEPEKVKSGSINPAEENLKGPGRQMPADEKFHFYGDIQKKANIVRDTKISQIYKYSILDI